MKTVYRSLAEAKDEFGPCAVAIGNFDGVHLGHQTLLRQTRQIAWSNGWKTAVLTFDPHPAAIVAPERAPRLICSLQERLRLLEQAGAEQILVLPFTPGWRRCLPKSSWLKCWLRAGCPLSGKTSILAVKQTGNTEVMVATDWVLILTLLLLFARGEFEHGNPSNHVRQGGWNARKITGAVLRLEGEVVSGHGMGSKQLCRP